MKSPILLLALFLAITSFAQQKAQLVVTTGKHRLMPNGSLSPDGKFILTDDCITGKIWDVKSGKFLMQLNADREIQMGGRFLPMYSFDFLPDGRVSQWGDDVIKIYDIHKPGAVTEIKLPGEYIDTDWQNGEFFVATWDESTVSIRNLSTGKVIYKLKAARAPRRPVHLDIARGKLVDFNGNVYDFRKGKVVSLQGVDRMNDNQGTFMFAPAGDVIICRPLDGTDNMTDNAIAGRIYFWDTNSGKLLDSLAGQNFRPRFSPDGKLLITIAGHPDTWSDQLEYEVLHKMTGRDPAYISQQDEFMWDSTASIWDVHTRKLVRVLKGHASTLTGAQFSPDGALVVTSAIDSTARVFEAATGKLRFVFRGHESGAVEICEFGQGGKLLITTSWDRTCKVWNTQTGKLIHTLKPFAMATEMVVADRKGDRFLSVDQTQYPARPMGRCDHCENLNGKLWESSSGREVRGLEFKEKPLPAFSPDGNALIGRFLNEDLGGGIIELGEGTRKFVKDYSPVFSRLGKVAFALAGDSLKVWRTDTEKPVLVLRVTPSTPPMLSDSEDYVLAADLSNELGIWSIANKSRLLSLGAAGVIEKMEFSEDGKRFMTVAKDRHVMVWEVATKKVVIDLHLKEVYPKELSLSATGKYLVSSGNKEQILFDAHGDTLATVKGSRRSSNIFGSLDDTYFLLDTEGKKQEIFDPLTRKITKSINVESNANRLFLASRNVVFISNLADGLVRLWDITTGKMVDPLFHVPAGIRSLNFSGDRNTLFVTAMDGSISILRGAKFDQHLVTLYPVGESDWVVTHPSGLFDATPGAVDKLYFIQGFDVIQFDQLKDRYYEPGLWKKVMSGESLRNVVGFKSIDLPPDVEVGQVDGEGYLTIQLTNRGGGIGEVNVFVNGKEVIKDARDASVKPEAANASLKIFVGKHKSIMKGQENLIGVKVWNKDHWVQSKGQIVYYQSKEIEKYKPAVHVLTCGVSDYTGTEIDLKYAAKDANDMSVALQLGAKKLFGADRSYVYNLTTTQPKEFYPTKTNILKAFEKIASTAHPLDIFVMYVSGHGINYGGQDGDWHYLTQEAYTGSASAYSDPAIRAQTTISSNELVELFKKVPALKQVLMLDACASGKVVDNLIAQKDIESSTIRALDRMRDRTGMHIITGCTADAVSYEASKYGQGVLTYSLLEGIRGAALREDQFVDVNKLFQYAQERVPQLAGGIGGIQSPQVFSPQGSQSFDIGLLTSTEKTAIPIAKIRPVYIRSNFQDENEMEDVLNIGKAIDESLNEASAKGVDASIIFVDVRDYPDACKLSGRYKKAGGQIVLKLRKKCGAADQTFDIKAPNLEALKAEVLKKL